MDGKLKIAIGVLASVLAGFGVGAASNMGLDLTSLTAFIGDTASNQIAQAGFFFTAAAWIHSGRVKKEISRNFVLLTDAINNVATTLRQDLEKHGKRLDNLTDRVENLEEKTVI